MEKIKEWFKKISCDKNGDVYHVDVLDGLRAVAVLIVLWFHFWQQTWLMPTYVTPFLKWLGISQISPDIFRRVGYLFVDMMVLISAFSLFLPHARTMVMGEKAPSIKRFYQKRAARILPSYYICVAFMFVIAVATQKYSTSAYMYKDLFSHLSFTKMFWRDTYIYTNLNVVLWTVSLLVMFYAVFPWIAIAFRKLPLVVYVAMVGLGLGATFLMSNKGGDMSMYVNQFPTFLPVFANGMGAAYIYVWFTKKCSWRRLLSPLFTAAAILLVVLIVRLMSNCSLAYPESQRWQMEWRYVLSLAFAGFVLCAAFSIKAFRSIFSNPVAKAFASISFNLYIWHQWIMVQLRSALGYKDGGAVAAAGGNAQLSLTVTAFLLSLAVAIFMTYCVEKPLSKLILNIGRKDKNAISL